MTISETPAHERSLLEPYDAPADTEGPAAAPVLPPAPPIDYAADARDLVATLHQLVEPVYPSVAAVLPPEVRERVALRLARVLEKYGLTAAGLFGRFEPEIMLALTIIPLVPAVVAAVRADNNTAQSSPGSSPSSSPSTSATSSPSSSPLADFPGVRPGDD